MSHFAVAQDRQATGGALEQTHIVLIPSVHVDDRDLLRLMADGHDGAAGVLYDRYGSPLYGLVFRLVGEQSDAEEVVMDTFVQAWRQASNFDEERGSVHAWLTMMARSRALDLLRSRGRRARIAQASQFTDQESVALDPRGIPGESLEHEERRHAIATALALLSEPQRVVIELAYFEGLSQSEIAERLVEPLGTIKTRARLGMQKLRDALRPFYLDRH